MNSSSDLSNTSIAITDAWNRKVIPIIRALGQKEVRIVALSNHRMPLAAFSKHCDQTYHVPSSSKQASQFVTRVKEICSRKNIDALLPLEEESIRALLKFRDTWSPAVASLLPDSEAFGRADDKWRTLQAAKRLDIDVPQTHCPEGIEEVRELAAIIEGEWVVKPRKSGGSRGLRYVNEPEELVETYRDVSSTYERPLIQQRIPTDGPGIGVFACFDRRQEPVALFGHRRLREYPLSGGPSTLRESYRDEQLIGQCVELLQDLSWTGIAMVEFKRDLESGRTYLLEINPRFWGSIQLAISSGVNFPVFYHSLALGRSVTPTFNFPEGIQCRWLLPGDILHFLQNTERFDMEPSFFRFYGSDLYYDISSWRDPGPMAGILLEGLRKLC